MKKETSAGAVVFRKGEKSEQETSSSNSQIKYLILQYTAQHWDFPKGHIEPGESEIETVKRETEEETGIKDITILDGFKATINYSFKHQNVLINKDVHFFIAETKTEDITLSHEHIGFKWLPFDEALKKVTFETAKDVLRKANEFLKQNELN